MKRLIALIITVLLLSACTPAAVPTTAPQRQVAAAPTTVVNSNPAQAAQPKKDAENAGYPGQGGAPAPASSSSVNMVIKDAQIELMVKDTQETLDTITRLAADEGGYLLESNTKLDNEYLYASLRVSVPSQRFEDMLNHLRSMGVKVLNETASGQDVSAEYVDLSSRLVNLEATAARVREFLKNAQTVEESLKVNGQLSDLEGQIEQVKGQMKYYEGRAAFSTISIKLTPYIPSEPTPTPTPTPAWNPGITFDKASGLLADEAKGLVDVAIWLVVGGGPWIALIVIVILIWRKLSYRGGTAAR